jgi:hypothetical protein
LLSSEASLFFEAAIVDSVSDVRHRPPYVKEPGYDLTADDDTFDDRV